MSLAYSALRPTYPAGAAQPYRHPKGTDRPETPVPAPATPAPRVRVAGSAGWTDPATVRVALTRAWRQLGRPIVVVHDGAPFGVDAAARAWVAEHAVCGIRHELAIHDQADLTLAFPAPRPRPTGDRP